ncbi:MAG: peptidase domain-containing ABC transporter [Burkholderiales bacterium]
MKFPHTALSCFVAVARHHGLDLTVERLAHDHALGEAEPPTTKLLRIAEESGFKAKAAVLDWNALTAQPAAVFPLLLRLRNGNTVVAMGFKSDTAEMLVADPIADKPGAIPLSRESIESAWAGETLFLKRVYRLSDQNQPFGIRWFIPEILRQRSLFRDVVIAALVLHVIALTLPIFFQLVIDKVLTHQSYSTLYVLAFGASVCIVFEVIFSFLRQYLLLYATTKIDLRLATRVFAHLVNLPIVFFEKTLAGVLTQHMQQNKRIREFLTGRLFITILDLSALVVFIPVLFLYSVKLTVILLLFCTAISLVIVLMIGPFRRRLYLLYQAEAQRQGLLVETIHGMATVKAMALEPTRRKEWENRVAQAAGMHFRVGQISAAAQAATQLLDKLMLVTIIAVGASDVFSNALSVGALVAFQMLSSRVSGPLVAAVSLIHEYQDTALSVRMLGEVMNRPVESSLGARGLRPQFRGDIAFENVIFSYLPGQRAVDRVSFNIAAGSVVGIVGRSGSGKTTLARLVQGLYPIQEGSVRFDGLNARDIDVVHLRRNIGVVLQETFLFHGKVRENIAMTKQDATFEEVQTAVRMAGADEFIDRLPQGIDTVLEEGGANLSGGQKQRLAIARALLTQPRILVFDEATSALDPESEAIVQRNLATIAHGRTLLMITHRLSSLVNADTIFVMDRGQIVATGRHDEMVKQPGLYKDLWEQQTRFAG